MNFVVYFSKGSLYVRITSYNVCYTKLLRIPQWQEKMESFIRLLRLAQSLPPAQLCAQLESSLRYWMGTQSLQVLQRNNFV